jgi:hypothetical protein
VRILERKSPMNLVDKLEFRLTKLILSMSQPFTLEEIHRRLGANVTLEKTRSLMDAIRDSGMVIQYGNNYEWSDFVRRTRR